VNSETPPRPTGNEEKPSSFRRSRSLSHLSSLQSTHAASGLSLKQRSVRGGFVVLISQLLKFTLQTGSVVVMARLLSPVDFGLQGMVLALTGVLGLFRDAGLGAATIQREEITHEQISTLFWINVALGMILTVIAIALAPALVAFYHEPRLFWVTIVSASAFLVNSLGVQHGALLNREMRFVALAKIEIAALLVSSLVGVTMALYGFGYWSFVGVAVSGPVVSVLGTWAAVPWIPGLPKRGTGVRSMLRFGGTLSLNGLVMYFGYNSEKILLGRYWGAAPLGLYGRAYQLLSLPFRQLHTSMSSVVFPALSQLQSNPEHQDRSFLRAYSALLCLTFPITLVSGLFSDELVYLVLGAKWAEAAPILKYLTPTILIYALINPYGIFLYASGRAMRSTFMSFVLAPTVVLAVWLGMPYGPKGVAIGYSTAMGVLLLPMTIWAFHGTGISLLRYWKAIRYPILAACAALASGVLVNLLTSDAFRPIWRFSIGCSIVLSVYVAALLVVKEQRQICFDLASQIVRRKKPAQT